MTSSVTRTASTAQTTSLFAMFADLLRTFPQQARFALGTQGVALAAVAGVVGLLCCAISLAMIALSLHPSELQERERRAAEIAELHHSGRMLVAAMASQAAGQLPPQGGQEALRQAWARVQSELASVCRQSSDRLPYRKPLQHFCSSRGAYVDHLAPQIEALASSGATFAPSLVSEVMASLSDLNEAAASDAVMLVGRMSKDYLLALLVLTLSTVGFAGGGLVLILLVGYTSMKYHDQWADSERSRELLQDTLETLPAGVAVYDADERLMLFNSAAAAVSPALQHPGSVGRTFEELSHETARVWEIARPGPQPVEDWISRFRTKSNHYMHRTADGSWIDCFEKATPSGRTVCLRLDVTPLKAQEQALQRAHARYQTLVSSLSDVVFALDERGRFTFVSAAAQDLFGVAPEKMIGRYLTDYLVADDINKAVALGRSHLKSSSNAVYQAYLRIKRADGTERHVGVRYRKPAGDLGDGTEQVGVIRDIEERMRLRRRLEEETARLRSIVESSAALFVLIDRDLRIVMVNSEFTAATGVSEADSVGRPLKEVVDCPLDQVVLDSWLAEPGQRRNLHPVRFTNEIVDSEGKRRILAVTATPVVNASGEVENVVFLAIDDTERREAEQALFDAERLATVGEMAATVAHEIAQPLQVIYYACEELTLELAEAAVGETPINGSVVLSEASRISAQVDRATRILDDLRAFIRGSAADAATLFDPAAAVRSAVDLTKRGVHLARSELTASLTPGLPMLMGHVGKLEQVLINLINNARDTGTPMIEVSASAVKQDGRKLVRIAVEDRGPGIASDVLPRLFVSFITTKPRGKGTGLGLRICRRIVEEMGGTISASNRPEGGARFDILIPAATLP